MSDKQILIVISIFGLLVLFSGFVQFAIPYTQAEVIVDLVKKSPPNDLDIYAKVAENLSKGRALTAAITIGLGAFIALISAHLLQRSQRTSKAQSG